MRDDGLMMSSVFTCRESGLGLRLKVKVNAAGSVKSGFVCKAPLKSA